MYKRQIKNSAVYFETSVDAGIKRTTREFRRVDIAFLSVGHEICFFHTDSTTHKDMSIIGKIIGEIKLLENVESGDEIKFYCETG